MFEILDIIIGLFFVYLVLSLVCTAVNEYIASIINKRGKELIKGINKLLEDPNLQNAFYDHPLVKTMFPDRTHFVAREKKVEEQSWWLRGVYRLGTYLISSKNRQLRAPSYLPARSFALALLDVVSRGAAAGAAPGGQQPPADAAPGDQQRPAGAVSEGQQPADAAPRAATPDEVETLIKRASDNGFLAIAELLRSLRREPAADVTEYSNLQLTADLLASPLPVGSRERVLTGLLGAHTGVQKLQDGIEVWFNSAMDRVSGTYKRYTQTVLFVISLTVAIIANADTLQLWRRLATDDELRDGLVSQAIAYFSTAVDTAGARGRGASAGSGTVPGTGATQGGASGTAGGITTGAGAVPATGGTTTGAGAAPATGGTTTGAGAAPTTGGGTAGTAGTQGGGDVTTGGTTGGGGAAPGGAGAAGVGTPSGGSQGGDGTSGNAVRTANQQSQEHARVVFDSAVATLERTDLDLGWTWEEAERLGFVRRPTAHDTVRAARADTARAIELLNDLDPNPLELAATRADSLARIKAVLSSRPAKWHAASIGGWRWGGILGKLFGLLITAFALSLGAPFWFDTLNKFINIRAAGRAPHEKAVSPEAPGKRPAGTAPM